MNAESDMKQIKKKLTVRTFKKWPFKEDFSVETDEQGYMSLVGKVCCYSLAHKE